MLISAKKVSMDTSRHRYNVYNYLYSLMIFINNNVVTGDTQ